jgi:hypothetical protein
MGLKVKAIERNVSFVKDGEPVWEALVSYDSYGNNAAKVHIFCDYHKDFLFFLRILPEWR